MPGEPASLLDIEPSLGRIVGATAAAAIGHQRRLPVFALEVGKWAPPARNELGAGTLALVVLDGWLLRIDGSRTVLGPGDRLEPWTRGLTWTACTGMRLAVLGEAFTAALGAWPAAAEKLRAARRPSHPPLTAAPDLEEQLLDLLWSLARHWGTLDRAGIALPFAVAKGPLALITAATEPRVAVALKALRRRGAITRGRDGNVMLVASSVSRRDALRGRMTEQFVLARLAAAEYAALSASVERTQRRRARV